MLQRRAAGDLEWETETFAELLAVSVDESTTFLATWTGGLNLPATAGTPDGTAAGVPGLRRPGRLAEDDPDGVVWRVLVEEHELFSGDPEAAGAGAWTVLRLVDADTITP